MGFIFLFFLKEGKAELAKGELIFLVNFGIDIN